MKSRRRHLNYCLLFIGEQILKQGWPGRNLYFVRAGFVDLTIDGTVADTVHPGDMFGEVALLALPPEDELTQVCPALPCLAFCPALPGFLPCLALPCPAWPSALPCPALPWDAGLQFLLIHTWLQGLDALPQCLSALPCRSATVQFCTAMVHLCPALLHCRDAFLPCRPAKVCFCPATSLPVCPVWTA